MQNSVIIRVLKSLSAEEFKEFDKFIHSPYFNTSAATTKLFESVKSFYPAFEELLLKKKNIFKKMNPGKDYDDVLMRKYISNLNKLAEEFLTIRNNNFPKHSLLSGLVEKNLYSLFLLRIKKEKRQFNDEIVDDEHFQYQSLIKGEELNYYIKTDKEFEYEAEKMNLLEYDTLYYFYRLAQVYYNRLSIAVEDDNDIIYYLMRSIGVRNLYNELEKSKFRNKKILKFLLSLMLLKQTRDENLYKEVKEFTFSYSDVYFTKALFIGYLYMHEFVTYKIDQGDLEYFKERYEIYKHQEKVIYSDKPEMNRQMSFVIFKNYFNSALRNNDTEWAESLIDKYINIFEKKGEKLLRNYFMAFLLFQKKRFEEAHNLLADINLKIPQFDDFALTREMRTLFLQIYLELGYYEDAFYIIDSFSHYLKHNKKVNQKNRMYYGNFVKFYRDLLTMVTKDDFDNLHSLKKKIFANKIIKKNWLVDKIIELEQKNAQKQQQ